MDLETSLFLLSLTFQSTIPVLSYQQSTNNQSVLPLKLIKASSRDIKVESLTLLPVEPNLITV
jgi:hypothetical protein